GPGVQQAWTSTWSNDLAVSTPATPTGVVRHVVVALDATGDVMTLYVNGVAVGTATKTDGNTLNAHSGDIGIGAMRNATRFHDGNAGGDGFHYAGVLDEVALYNAALTPAQVATHYAAGS
ncbi:MAG: LamG-like jellyroll fold domain-containing protein, partial [Actinomycetota bacterium]